MKTCVRLVEMIIFSLDNVFVFVFNWRDIQPRRAPDKEARPNYIMSLSDLPKIIKRAELDTFLENKELSKILHRKKNQKDSTDFQHWKITLKIGILRSLMMSLTILVGLTMTWYSKKMMICTRCIHGFMPNLHKKYWMVILHACLLAWCNIYLPTYTIVYYYTCLRSFNKTTAPRRCVAQWFQIAQTRRK